MRPQASSPSSQISIGRLNLRVPGQGKETGANIARGLTEHLANGQSGLRSQHIGALNLRVTVPPGASEAAVAEAVSHAILRTLSQNRHA